MPRSLHFKRTPAEQAAHDARKARRAARRAEKEGEPSRKRQRRERASPKLRRWASDDEDEDGNGSEEYGPQPARPGAGSSRHTFDPDAIRAEVEEARFREKMFGALDDDERLDFVEARLNDYAHVPKRWRTHGFGAGGVDQDQDLLDADPRLMEDEEYAEWVRAGMWRRKHAAEHAEQQRQQAAFAAIQAEAAVREKAAANARRAKRRERERRREHDTRMLYDQRWRELLQPPAPDSEEPAVLSFADIPWPILKGKPSDGEVLHAISVEELTAEAISSFLFLLDVEQDLDPAGLAKMRKERLRETMLRFHPDKFEGRVMTMVREQDKNAVREGVGAVVRAVSALMGEKAS